jgi:hypothetical protein
MKTKGYFFPSFLIILFLGCVIHHQSRFYIFELVYDNNGYATKIREWQSDQFIEVTFSLAQKVLEEKIANKEKSFALDYYVLQIAYNDLSDMEFVILMLDFIQHWSSTNYLSDNDWDYWPTLSFVLRTEREDCDGFELLMYHSLRERVTSGKVFRAIMSSDIRIVHHMVTLWFDNKNDPILMDPTGVIVDKPVRLSKTNGWKILVMFDDNNIYKPYETHRSVSK